MSASRYPTAEQVRRFVNLGRELGLDVVAIEVSRGGLMRIVDARGIVAASDSITDFDRLRHIL